MVHNYCRPQQRAGFTLLELVVASALFAVVITLAVNLFVVALRTPIQEIDRNHLYEEVTYVFEQATYYIHHATIDYTTYGTITNPTTQLYLIANDGSNTQYRFYLNSGQIYLTITPTTGTATTYPLTTNSTTDVYIDAIKFYVYPTVDPFNPDNSNNNQPTVVMQIQGHSVKHTAITFKMQTLITLRSYAR